MSDIITLIDQTIVFPLMSDEDFGSANGRISFSIFGLFRLSEIKPMNSVITSGEFNAVCIFNLVLHLRIMLYLLSPLFFLSSAVESRLLWERVEKLVPRPGSGSSSGSSNSGSQPGSQSGSGERFRVRCRVTFCFSFPVNDIELRLVYCKSF